MQSKALNTGEASLANASPPCMVVIAVVHAELSSCLQPKG